MPKIEKSDADWRAELTPDQYAVLRRAATEPAGTGTYLYNKATGVYTCGACGAELFRSGDKYDSGCGWPSFTQALHPDSVELRTDNSHGMRRVEVRCAACESHLGHVFDDGPAPTGQRFCMNSLALGFTPDATPK